MPRAVLEATVIRPSSAVTANFQREELTSLAFHYEHAIRRTHKLGGAQVSLGGLCARLQGYPLGRLP